MRTISTHLAASSAASGLKWMSATIGTRQPRARNSATMFLRLAASLTVGAVMRTSLAARRDQFERLPHALGGVHGVASEHGLDDHRMVAADDDAAPRRVAHDHFAGGPAPPQEWGIAEAHVSQFFSEAFGENLMSRDLSLLCFQGKS